MPKARIVPISLVRSMNHPDVLVIPTMVITRRMKKITRPMVFKAFTAASTGSMIWLMVVT